MGPRVRGDDQQRVRVLPFADLHSCSRSVCYGHDRELPALEQADTMAPHAASGRLRRLARPALGLLLPVGLALAWEIIVWLGLSSGRFGAATDQTVRHHCRTGAQR